MDVDLWSNSNTPWTDAVTRIKFLWSAHFCWPDTMRAAGMGTVLRCYCGHPGSSPPPLPSFTHCRRHWPNYSCKNDWWGRPLLPEIMGQTDCCRRRLVVGGLTGAVAVAPYRRLAVRKGLSNDGPCWVCIGVLRCAFARNTVRSLGGVISQGWRIRDWYRVIDMKFISITLGALDSLCRPLLQSACLPEVLQNNSIGRPFFEMATIDLG